MNTDSTASAPPGNPEDLQETRSIAPSEPPGSSATGFGLPSYIGRYRITRLVGQGGMGAVYEAEQDNPRRIVALKVIKAGCASPELLRRFEQESQALGRLQHPGIAQIYEAGTSDTGFGPQPYFAMELIQGQSLRDYSQTHRLNVRQRLELMAKICEAVHHAHQRGLIHRDLKPGNILVDETGQPKILDFGVARVTDSDAQATRQTDIGQLVGTLAYMSPEQVLADPLELDTRSDVYALGVILYELLAGRMPYDINHSKLHEALKTIQEADPVPLSSIQRIYRGDIETIVSKTLEKEKTRRYSSAAGLAADIRRYLADEPIVARPPSTTYQLQKFARRHKALVAGVAAVFAVLVAGIVASTWEAARATRAERAAIQERDKAERRFQDLRKLARSVVFELHDAIQYLPGSTAARKLLVERALEYLDRLAQQVGSDRSLQLELASAYEKVGDVQGNPYNSNLGDAKAAIQSYRKSLAIREKVAAATPQDWQAQSDLASSYTSLGQMLASSKATEALEYFRKAAAISSVLAKAHPSEKGVREQLSSDLIRLGEMQWDTGDSSRALSNYGKALEVQEALARAAPANQKVQRDLSAIYNRIGFALSDSGDPAAALKSFEKCRAIREHLATADPVNASLQRDLWTTNTAIGDVLGNPNLQNLGRPAEALRNYRKSLAIAKGLAAADSSNIRARRDIALSLTRIADVLQITGDLPGAVSNYRQSLTLIEALQIANPLNNGLRRDQGIGFERLARALAAARNNKGALDYFNRALSLQQKLAEADVKSARAREDWLDTVYNVGDYLLKTRNLQAAGEHLARGREEAEKMLTANPENISARRLAANFSDKLGDYHAALASAKGTPTDQQESHRQKAHALYRRAAEQFGELQKLGKLTASDKKDQANLARKLLLRGRG